MKKRLKQLFSKEWVQALLVIFAIALVIGVLAAGHAIAKKTESEFVKKLSIPQMDFTQMESFDEATAAIQAGTDTFLNTPILWTSERGNITRSPLELGATASLGDIEQYFADFDDLAEIKKIAIWFFGKELRNPITIDLQQMHAAFEGTGIEQGNKSASYFYSGGTVQIEPEQIGYGINEEVLSMLLQDCWESDFEISETEELPLRTSNPAILQSDLEEFLPKAQELTLVEFELQSEWGTTWYLDVAGKISWLQPSGIAGTVFSLDQDALQAYLEEDIIPSIEKDPQTVTITETADDSGNVSYEFDGSARFGKRIDVPALKTILEGKLQEVLANEAVELTLNLPIITLDPEVNVPDALAERGITDLLEFGYTDFGGSPYNRIYNIGHGMEIYNGIILEQGAEFSFTTLLGPVDGAHGWLEELVILGDETKPEYGGGLCQVSSTMYRAALYAGLPITARQEHSYAVSYYAYPNGYGLDATVYQPWPDLRFLNDTPGDILIQGYTEGTLAYFVMYGANDGRSVQMEGPQYHSYVQPGPAETTYTTELAPGVRELDSHAHTGFQVDWFRTIFYGDGTQSERMNIHTFYEARPEKWLEGVTEDMLEEEID